MTIWKFPLEARDTQQVKMPVNAKALSVQMQRGIPCLWALVNGSSNMQCRTVFLVGTGHHSRPELETATFVDTFQMEGGSLVFHVFMEKP